MYITIDGDSGAGKSTQFHALAERFGLKSPGWFATYKAFQSVPLPKQRPGRYTRILAAIFASHTIPVGEQHWIVDHFWSCFYEFRDADESTLSNIITFFRTGLTLNDRPEPAISVFLDVPPDVSHHRRHQRDNELSMKYEPSDYNRNQHNRDLTFWQTIAANCPYFHVLDGNRPVADVTESISQLLPECFHPH